MKPYFESDYIRVSYEPSGHYIALQWLTPPTNKEFKEGCEQMLLALKHFKTGRVIVDARQQGAVHPDLIEWMGRDWSTRAIAVGYSHCAIITPTDVFASFSLAEIAERGEQSPVIVEFFDQEELAIDWVKKLSVNEAVNDREMS